MPDALLLNQLIREQALHTPGSNQGSWRTVKKQIPRLPHLIALSGAHSTGVQAVGGVRAVAIPFSCPRVCKTGKRKPGLCRAQFPLTHTVSRVRASVTPTPSSASLQAGSPELWAWCVCGAPKQKALWTLFLAQRPVFRGVEPSIAQSEPGSP